MSELLTLDDIAAMWQTTRRRSLMQIVKTPGFPPMAPGANKKFPLWFEAEVLAFIRRQQLPERPALPQYKVLPPSPQLYRHFDADGKLLYVGVSTATMRRLSEHRTDSRWFWSVARIEIERHPTIRAAREAEKKAIREERPLFNVDYGKIITAVVEVTET